jgi:hypothetical protein
MKSSMIAILLLAAAALPAAAGTAPVKSKLSPGTVATSCKALGADGAALATGCVNTKTGGAVTCAGGQCTDYFADPRYSKIKALLDADRAKPQQQPL